MKKILIFILSVFPSLIFSQSSPFTDVFPFVNGKVVYSEVIQVEGKSVLDLYKNAKIWLVEAFKSSKDVIHNDDKDNHIIIGKGYFEGVGHNKNIVNAKYWFTIRIDCREGRYKYTITDFIYDFDVIVMGTKTHFNEDFSKWGNVAFDTKYKELLDKKYPPNNERNAKQQEKYEKYKEELDNELEGKYKETIGRYSLLDKQIKSMIESLNIAMKQSEDNW